MDISQVLLNTQSPDANLRRQAEEHLNNALQSQMGQFMLTLTQALASEGFAPVGRQAAGLYLKNVLDAKDYTLQQKKIEAWMAMDPALRSQIKQGALQVLQSQDQIARHTGAQLVAKIGSIELPKKQWPTLLSDLLKNVTGSNEHAQHSTLEALGYLCEELEEDAIDQDDTNNILTAIVDGVRSDRPDNIRHAAITALRNSLEFICENFKRDQERNHIMQVVCEATQSSNIKVRVVSFECIATIATLYYDYLQPYMQALYELTFKAVQSDQPEVGLQSIEFWSSICDVEIDLIEDAEYAALENRVANNDCKFYVKNVLGNLVPLLTDTLKQQDEDQDEDTWNISMAGATCLGLVSQTVRDDVVDGIMPFITSNIQSNEWRLKEAAIMAFGSILDGPSTEKIGPIICQAMGMLMGCMTDANILVRDTTAWSIGRICELHSACITGEMLPPLMQLLAQGLGQEPRVAHNICYAIHNLAKAFEESKEAVHMLTPYFSVLFDKLLETTHRADWSENNLRGAAYEAISMLIQVGSPEVSSHIMSRLPSFLERLEASLNAQDANPDERDDHSGLQALLCGVLLVTIQRMGADVNPLADRMMKCLLRVFNSRNAAAGEEAFMAAGALANAMNGEFIRYMEYFGPVLLMGLNNTEEYMVCSVAVGVVGDLCRALEGKMRTYSDEIVSCLLNNLRNPDLNRSVKPPVLSSFGDLALSIEGEFERYLKPVMEMLIQAAEACKTVDPDDEDLVDYMNQLRESILEAFTGIVQGLGASNKGALMNEYVQGIVGFIACLAADMQTRNEAVTSGCVGLLGDLGHTLGASVRELVTRDFVFQLLNECIQSSSPNAQNVGQWAQGVIQQLRVQSS